MSIYLSGYFVPFWGKKSFEIKSNRNKGLGTVAFSRSLFLLFIGVLGRERLDGLLSLQSTHSYERDDLLCQVLPY